MLTKRRRKKNAAAAAAAVDTNAPSSPPKSLRNSPTSASTTQYASELSSLLKEMDELIALDRILDARKVVDQIRDTEAKIGFSPHGLISPDACAKMDEILSESNHIDHLLSDLRSDDTWHLVKSRGGITVHYRNEEGSPIHSVKTHTILENVDPIGFVRICSLFLESDLFPVWAPHNIIESCDILASPSKFRQILQMKLSFGRFSPLSPRDAIVEGRGYHLADDNAVLILSTSITESPFCAVPAKTRTRVRIDMHAAFYIQLLPGNRVLFRQISHDDLKIRFMPAFVVNFLAQGAMPYGMIQSLKAVLRRYEETEFYNRMTERRDFYADIEDRVHKELVSNVSRMDTGEMEQSSWSSTHIDDDDDNDVSLPTTDSSTRLHVVKRHIGGGASGANLSPNSNTSLVATGTICLACIFLTQFGVKLSLCWVVLPKNIQLTAVACAMSLPALMYVGSRVSKCRGRGGTTIRVRKRDGSVVAELHPEDSPERQYLYESTPKKKISLTAPVIEDDEEILETEAPPSGTSTSNPAKQESVSISISTKTEKKRPALLRKMMRRKKDKK